MHSTSDIQTASEVSMHPQNTQRACVLGAGPMGQAMASMLRIAGAEVSLWSIEKKESADLTKLDSIGVMVTNDFEQAIEGCLIIFFAIPASALTEVAEKLAPYSRGYHVAVHGIRGVTEDFLLPHQIIKSKTNIKKIGVFGGPIYFEELSAGRILVAVMASRFDEVFKLVEDNVKNTQLLLHKSDDITGVEIAGAFSNVTAIAVGIADALKLGETVKGMLLTRGLSEATTLGIALGAQEKTFSGLAGVGDLIPRKVNSIDRHIELGKQLIEGKSLSAIVNAMNGSVEGLDSAKGIEKKSAELGLSLPLMHCIFELLSTENPKKLAEEKFAELLTLDLFIGAELVESRKNRR